MTVAMNWFDRTRQRWKVTTLLLLLIPLVVTGIAAILTDAGVLARYDISAGIASVVFGVLFLGWFAVAFRCPRCQTRVGIWLLRRPGSFSWFTDFLTLQTCPNCGDNGQAST
jgi:predicted RNA-binding Zn-ribbon protein involved in translation (DUF1610 family)